MDLFDRIKMALGIVVKGVAAPPMANTARAWQDAPRPSSHKLLELYRDSIEFRTIVDAISSRVAATPQIVTDSAGDPLPDHPLQALVDQPMPGYMSGAQERRLETTWLDILDECYLHLLPPGELGDVFRVAPLVPTWVTPKREDGITTYKVDYPSGGSETLSDEEVVWIKHLDVLDPYGRPHGKGYAAGDEIETAEYAGDYHKAFFRNSAVPGAIISVGDKTHRPSQAQLDQVRAEWAQKYQGADKAWSPSFLPGNVSVHPMQQPLKDLAIHELRKYAADAIRQLYCVPPEVIGQLEHSNRATIQEALAILSVMALVPRLDFRRQELSTKMLPRLAAMGMGVDGVTLDYVDPTPPDYQRQLEAAKANPSSLTRNEWRALQGLPPREDGDVYVVDAGDYLPIEAAPVIEDAQPLAATGGGERKVERDDVALYVIKGGGSTVDKSADADIEIILRDLQPDMIEAAWAAHTMDTLDMWIAAAGRETGYSLTQQMINPFVAQYMRDEGAVFIASVQETTREDVRTALMEGIAKGEGPRALTERVRALHTWSRTRAELIAVTETNRAANAAKAHAYRLNPAVEKTRWLTSFRNSRPSHVAMHRQERAIGVEFVSGRGHTTLHPGGFGIASEDCRCKCTIVAAIAGEARSVDDEDAYRKAHEDSIDTHSKALEGAMADALGQQLEDVVVPAIQRVRGMEVTA